MSAVAMTFSEQQSMLSRLLMDSNTSTDDMWPLADRKFEINRGEVQFAKDTKILQGYATGTVASQQISIPSDWIETHVLVVDDEVFTNDREISLTEWERYVDSGGDYYYYWVDASNNRILNFINTSQDGDTYKLWYFRRPTTALSADDDTSVLPDEYREASVYFAAYRLLKQTGQTQLADIYYRDYLDLVSKGMLYARKLYMNKEKAMPDLGQDYNEEPTTDIQGKWR